MDSMALRSTRISDLVAQDHVRAYVLYHFGIHFYEYAENTLEDVCRDKALDVERVVQEFESPTNSWSDEHQPISTYSVDLILEYLKHDHFLFVKRKLPYISRLVESFSTHHTTYQSIVKDLKTLFPLFVEDFVRHIYFEEHKLFRYIRSLNDSMAGKANLSKLMYAMELHSLQRFSMEHDVHDDEMRGIRKITQDYYTDSNTPLHIRVLYSELIAMERSLKSHARIENEILFPKAMTIENEIKGRIQEKIKFN